MTKQDLGKLRICYKTKVVQSYKQYKEKILIFKSQSFLRFLKDKKTPPFTDTLVKTTDPAAMHAKHRPQLSARLPCGAGHLTRKSQSLQVINAIKAYT